jgi:hypothetical protein
MIKERSTRTARHPEDVRRQEVAAGGAASLSPVVGARQRLGPRAQPCQGAAQDSIAGAQGVTLAQNTYTTACEPHRDCKQAPEQPPVHGRSVRPFPGGKRSESCAGYSSMVHSHQMPSTVLGAKDDEYAHGYNVAHGTWNSSPRSQTITDSQESTATTA